MRLNRSLYKNCDNCNSERCFFFFFIWQRKKTEAENLYIYLQLFLSLLVCWFALTPSLSLSHAHTHSLFIFHLFNELKKKWCGCGTNDKEKPHYIIHVSKAIKCEHTTQSEWKIMKKKKNMRKTTIGNTTEPPIGWKEHWALKWHTKRKISLAKGKILQCICMHFDSKSEWIHTSHHIYVLTIRHKFATQIGNFALNVCLSMNVSFNSSMVFFFF